MAHKTFISYKYSEARELRDRIIRALGDDAKYYNGEDGYSDDMSSLATSTIKKKLTDMLQVLNFANQVRDSLGHLLQRIHFVISHFYIVLSLNIPHLLSDC